ncbi:MAG: hypothetical protein HDQ87_05510 [Clostridia bacterium]|nr:hypothetical protein [Clostridia bacterium]
MKCSKYRKLIHRMLDGDLNKEDQRRVCAHLETCEACRSYYDQVARICAELRQPDPQPPEGFEQRWKQALAEAAAPRRRSRKKKMRPGVLVPVVACCAAAMFVVSTLLINPQAFGLEGSMVTGEWFGAVVPEKEPEPEPSVSQGDGQKVSFVATSEKKPNVVDYENAEYSETTTKSTQVPKLSAAGTIEPRPNEIMSTVKEAMDAHATALPEEVPVVVLSVAGEEQERLRGLAHEMELEIVAEDEAGLTVEGSPEQLEEFAGGYHLDIPPDAEWVRLQLQ